MMPKRVSSVSQPTGRVDGLGPEHVKPCPPRHTMRSVGCIQLETLTAATCGDASGTSNLAMPFPRTSRLRREVHSSPRKADQLSVRG